MALSDSASAPLSCWPLSVPAPIPAAASALAAGVTVPLLGKLLLGTWLPAAASGLALSTLQASRCSCQLLSLAGPALQPMGPSATPEGFSTALPTPPAFHLLPQTLPYPAAALPRPSAQAVLLPALAGSALGEVFPGTAATLRPLCTLAAAGLMAVHCASYIAHSGGALRYAGPRLLGAVIAMHAGAGWRRWAGGAACWGRHCWFGSASCFWKYSKSRAVVQQGSS